MVILIDCSQITMHVAFHVRYSCGVTYSAFASCAAVVCPRTLSGHGHSAVALAALLIFTSLPQSFAVEVIQRDDPLAVCNLISVQSVSYVLRNTARLCSCILSI